MSCPSTKTYATYDEAAQANPIFNVIMNFVEAHASSLIPVIRKYINQVDVATMVGFVVKVLHISVPGIDLAMVLTQLIESFLKEKSLAQSAPLQPTPAPAQEPDPIVLAPVETTFEDLPSIG